MVVLKLIKSEMEKRREEKRHLFNTNMLISIEHLMLVGVWSFDSSSLFSFYSQARPNKKKTIDMFWLNFICDTCYLIGNKVEQQQQNAM